MFGCGLRCALFGESGTGSGVMEAHLQYLSDLLVHDWEKFRCTNLAAIYASPYSCSVPCLSYLLSRLALHPCVFAFFFPASGSALFETFLAGLWNDFCLAVSPEI